MLEFCTLTCPYCWSIFETRVDPSGGSQEYYEDCPVCCNPIRMRSSVDLEGRVLDVQAERDDA